MLKVLGWKMQGEMPVGVKKMVIIEAPHTSNWDYVYGMFSVMAKGIKINLIIKKESFFWPLGGLLKKLGGIPLDRSAQNKKVDALADLFKQYDELYLSLTPEGTRSLVTNWKKGYYFIAFAAGVPILLTALDYPNKTAVFGPLIYPSGDYAKDFEKIKDFYKGVGAKFPEKFNLSPQYLNLPKKTKSSKEK